MLLPKFVILAFAFLAVFFGTLILGISRIIQDARCQQHHVIQQQRDDAHRLHDWRSR
jgi:hypothetical protein